MQTAKFLLHLIRKEEKQVRRFIEDGYDLNAQDGLLETALVVATREGNVREVQMLLDLGVCLENQNQSSPLIQAVLWNRKDLVLVLLAAGTDINALDPWGRTALIIACIKEYEDLVVLLVQTGADVLIVDQDNKTAHDYLINNQNLRLQAIISVN